MLAPPPPQDHPLRNIATCAYSRTQIYTHPMAQHGSLVVSTRGELRLAQCLHIPRSVTGMLAEVYVVRIAPLQPVTAHAISPRRGTLAHSAIGVLAILRLRCQLITIPMQPLSGCIPAERGM